MGQFHPKHRTVPVLYKKKRRNNRCLEKFYDAKYVDSRDGKKRTGQELFNGTRAILLPEKKPVAVKKLDIYRYAGGYYRSAFS